MYVCKNNKLLFTYPLLSNASLVSVSRVWKGQLAKRDGVGKAEMRKGWAQLPEYSEITAIITNPPSESINYCHNMYSRACLLEYST